MRMHPSIIEATRLTREGRLAEATALLRGMFARSAGSVPAAEPVVLRKEPVLLPGSVAPPGPQGERRRSGSFDTLIPAGPHDRLTYKLYVPAGASAGAPLLVMLHGCTQTPDDFAKGTRMNHLAAEFGFLVAYPQQPRSANASRC